MKPIIKRLKFILHFKAIFNFADKYNINLRGILAKINKILKIFRFAYAKQYIFAKFKFPLESLSVVKKKKKKGRKKERKKGRNE
jgi:hypothetical protein